MLRNCFIALFTMTLSLFASELRFSVPDGWECVTDQTQLPKKVQVLAISPTKTRFTPSINIATEDTEQTISDYVETAKLYHESEGQTKVTRMGQIPTKAGSAELLQIDRKTDFGVVRFIQAAIIEQETAYVITATCLRDEFASYCSSFFDSIKSFEIRDQ
ncbi:MAG: hypothetical protein S4CHLAM81_05270 [Chlamydiales bacterium]|nr:hypothetical protein [Chlamydiales bacterium]MCH9635313.1 hypothetical protein [Chlamydiales bacterium]MCH9704212.1 hypothetical protein [Chlamydiota bacterium]